MNLISVLILRIWSVRLIGYMSEFGYKDFIYNDMYTGYKDTNDVPNDDEVVSVVRLTFYK